ncbi:hypothetical protein V6N11_009380 [Hibiscus sabdariffa]|uniref:Uncharacterized protein n=1 Tax=Hibiscus sabdariffa TaxID=183260 RepID=A0ABR2NT58_9ROSI
MVNAQVKNLKSTTSTVDDGKLETLRRYVIGWCQSPGTMEKLANEIQVISLCVHFMFTWLRLRWYKNKMLCEEEINARCAMSVSLQDDAHPKNKIGGVIIPGTFLNCLLEKRAYVRTMELEWSCISHEIVVVNVIDQLRLMKQLLRVWNKDVFGSVDERIEATWMLCKECNHK